MVEHLTESITERQPEKNNTIQEPVSRGKQGSVRCYWCSSYCVSLVRVGVGSPNYRSESITFLTWYSSSTQNPWDVWKLHQPLLSALICCCLSLSHVFLFVSFKQDPGAFHRRDLSWKHWQTLSLSLSGRVINSAMTYCQQECPSDICRLWAMG